MGFLSKVTIVHALAEWLDMPMSTAIVVGERLREWLDLPSTRKALSEPQAPFARPARAVKLYPGVREDWLAWCDQNPSNQDIQLWLRKVYQSSTSENSSRWNDVVSVLLPQLVRVGPGAKAAYNHGILTPSRRKLARLLWQTLLHRFNVRVVLSTSWDIIAEQGLRSDYSEPLATPLFHYGGQPWPQFVRKMKDLSTGKADLVQLGKSIALFKLRGSINWAQQGTFTEVHEDVRAAFWEKSSTGIALVAPSLPEAELPDWSRPVWLEAANQLQGITTLVLCGHEPLLDDDPLRGLLHQMSKQTPALEHVIVIGGSREETLSWNDLFSGCVNVETIPRLPRGLQHESLTLTAETSEEVCRIVDVPKRLGRRFFTSGPVGNKPPSVFVSYTWEDDALVETVLELARSLRVHGFDVKVDRWETAPGDYLPEFMEKTATVDFVLMFCTPAYKDRFDKRKGGVGFEARLITGESLATTSARKFIPLLARGNWVESSPAWAMGKVYIDLRQGMTEPAVTELIRTLRGENPKPPPLGPF